MPAKPVNPAVHPTADTLRLLSLGKLDDATAEQVLRHLEGCPACRQAAAAMPGDSFLDRLRDAHAPSGTPAPAGSLAGVSRSLQGNPAADGSQAGVRDLPPELAENPHYEVLRELGRGGMGVVYLARNVLMDRLEVLKVVSRTLLDRPGAVDRFLQEIRAAAKLSHDNVVKAYSALSMGELLVFAMEYVEGEDLAKLVKQHGPLPVPVACFYAHQAALGLQHANENGLVHRDIKPANLIRSRQGRKHIVKVLDFGLAKASRERQADAGLTGQGMILGTPDYIAPEQTTDAATADVRADIYSLGCTLYYLLAGRPPFQRDTPVSTVLAHVMDEPQPLTELRPEVPAELSAVVMKMLAKDPAQRHQKAIEVAQALLSFVKAAAKESVEASRVEQRKSLVQVKPIPPVPRRRSAKPQRKWWQIGACVAGVFLLGLMGLWASGILVEVKTKDGILVVEVNEPNAEVYVDGQKVTVSWSKGGKKAEIAFKPGTRKVQVKKDGFAVHGEEVTIEEGGRSVLVARLEKVRPAIPPPVKKSAQPTPPTEFVSLFNGKDLTGWKPHRVGTARWEVKDGVLIGSGDTGHLFNTSKSYNNFHLRVEARVNDGGNSGVFFRTPFALQTSEGQTRQGYEAQINSTHKDPAKTGSLYIHGKATVAVTESPVESDRWFTLEVIADGPHIVVKVNGRVTVDKIDVGPHGRVGHFALQVLGAGTVVGFRKIEVKELPPGDPRLQWVHGRGVFEQVKGNVWLERIGTNRHYYRDTGRTREYVRLHRVDPNRNIPYLVHLHGPNCGVNHGGRRWWVPHRGGRWQLLQRSDPLPARVAAARVGEWVPLFNGKDLSGWKIAETANGKVIWNFEGEDLVARSGGAPIGLLHTVRADHDNFHLRMETIRPDSTNLSGLLIRCGPPDEGAGGNRSYLIVLGGQIGNEDVRIGSLTLFAHHGTTFPLATASEVPVKPGEWFALEVLAEASHIRVLINGKSVVDYQDANATFTAGRIVLSCPADGVAKYRKVEIKELPSGK